MRVTGRIERIRAMAAREFADHVVINEGDGRWMCAKPGTGIYHFRVITAPGTVILFGDIGARVFRISDRNSLAWLRGSVRSPEYVMEKAEPPYARIIDEDFIEQVYAEYINDPTPLDNLGLAFDMLAELFTRFDILASVAAGMDDVEDVVYACLSDSEFGTEEVRAKKREAVELIRQEFETLKDTGVSEDQAWSMAWHRHVDCDEAPSCHTREQAGWWHVAALATFVRLLDQARPAECAPAGAGWDCHNCGWNNVEVRKKCRECGHEQCGAAARAQAETHRRTPAAS